MVKTAILELLVLMTLLIFPLNAMGETFVVYSSDNNTTETTSEYVEKSDEEWKAILSPEVYYITRENGTERPYTGELNKVYDSGNYYCSNCGNLLFSSEHKYDSKTGWPSYWEVATPHSVTLKDDYSWFMKRVEVVCKRCGAHLGHVFDDGPQPTGLRYCINSLSMIFQAK